MIKWAINTLWDLMLKCTIFGIPFIMLMRTFSSFTEYPHVKMSPDEKMPANGYEYFEHKGWYEGNETLRYYNDGQCLEHEKASAFGVVYEGLRDFESRKCRGKWYHIKSDSKIYEACWSSVISIMGGFCNAPDSFCVDPSDGKILWNTHYDPRNPKKIVDTDKNTPRKNFTEEEERHVRVARPEFYDGSWKGYGNAIKRRNVYLDVGALAGTR